MSLFDRFRRKKEDPEQQRRDRLLLKGRIADGIVIDVEGDSAGGVAQIFYRYTVNGVDYESSQSLDTGQQARALDYAPGAHITVRYDPHQVANSVVV